MARVTVEDCIEKIPNRFELVMTAAQRARKIGAGSALTIDRDNDKNPVVALREVADETVEIGDLQEELIRSHQRIIMNDDEEEDVIDYMDGEEEWNAIVTEDAEGESAAPVAAEGEEPSLGDIAGGMPTEA